MNLCIDIGNSFIKYGIFDHDKLVKHGRSKKLLVRELKLLINKYSIQRAILSTTRKTLPRFCHYLERTISFITLDHRTKLPFENTYGTKKTLGKDRLAAVAGAQSLFPNKHCLVFDIGTCMTSDLISKSGVYLGGNISPGKDLRLRSMNDYTSALPLVKPKFSNPVIATNTKMALQNGAIYGIVFEIEAFYKRIQREKGKINVILTGGDAIKFGELLECKKFVYPNLVLTGLNAILKHNED